MKTFLLLFCVSTPKVAFITHLLAISYPHVRLGTVPTLVVPFENTLTAEMESRYKAITDIEASPPRYASELWAESRCIAGPDRLP